MSGIDDLLRKAEFPSQQPRVVEETMIIEAAFGVTVVNGNPYLFFDVPLGLGAVRRVSIKFDRISLAKVESEIAKLRETLKGS